MARRLLTLSSSQRTGGSNRALGYLMAFNAGAINAGGFVVLRWYTSHVTGFLSMLADHLVLGNTALVLTALGMVLAFLCGAVTSSILINWGRQQQLQSLYALPLILLALLMLVFGLVGAAIMAWRTPFFVPLTVLLLAFTMGVQNATLTKMSGSAIRTTHMTGVVTDLGIEIGRMLFWNRMGRGDARYVRANWSRVRLYAGLLALFLLGGIAGAWGFQRIGFACVLPLALVLLLVSLPPLWADWCTYRACRGQSPLSAPQTRNPDPPPRS